MASARLNELSHVERAASLASPNSGVGMPMTQPCASATSEISQHVQVVEVLDALGAHFGTDLGGVADDRLDHGGLAGWTQRP